MHGHLDRTAAALRDAPEQTLEQDDAVRDVGLVAGHVGLLKSVRGSARVTDQNPENQYQALQSISWTSLASDEVLKVGMRTIDRVKKKFVEEGLEAVLERRLTTRIYEKKSDGDVEAKLITLCCSEPPKGFAKWSLRLLADKMVELKYVESISHVTVRSVLKKTNLNLGK
jgi:hypothetical protein